MRILNIINSMSTGGAEKLLVESLPLYLEKGVNVDLLLLNGKETPFYLDIKKQGKNRILSLSKGSVYNPLNIFRMISHIKNYDIIHVHLFPCLYFVYFAKVLALSEVKIVFTEHSTSNRRFRSKIAGFLDRHVYRNYDMIICITDVVKKAVLNHVGIADNKISVIGNGVDLMRIKNAESISRKQISDSIKEDDFILLQVSSFQFPKDQQTLIRALVELPEKVKLILVGEGSLKESCIETVASLKLSNRVFFLGFRSDIPQLLKTANIVVLSSEYEGLSLSCIEGMASGRPFLASDVPGLNDIVGGAGLLFPFGDNVFFAKLVNNLMCDDELYSSVASKCLERASLYDINSMINSNLKLYSSLLKKDL